MIIATAGHVDHGKTALVKALTGVDTDRLAEERERGLTINLGFAYADATADARLAFVDVPGHQKFISNMLAGVAGIDFALLVVAADDGVMPQTIEHMQILDLLGIDKGLVAITKIDQSDDAQVERVRTQVEALLADTTLAGADIHPVSAQTGAGMDALRSALDAANSDAKARQAHGHFRLAVDRRFNVKGAGMVATGTVFAGTLSADDEPRLMPQGVPVRVRGLRTQAQEASNANAGDRCAINFVSGELNLEDVHRGDWITTNPIGATDRFDARLKVLAMNPLATSVTGQGAPVRHWTPVHLHAGANHSTARLAVLEGGEIAPGDTGLVQVVTDSPFVVCIGDRFIIRDQAAMVTLGGGVVLDPHAPARGRARPERIERLGAIDPASPAGTLARLLALTPLGLSLPDFAASMNLTEAEADDLPMRDEVRKLAGGHVIAASQMDALGTNLCAAVDDWHKANPDAPGLSQSRLYDTFCHDWNDALSEAVLADLLARKALVQSGGVLCRPDFNAQLGEAEAALLERARAELAAANTKPPVLHDLAKSVGVSVGELTRALDQAAKIGQITRATKNRYFLPETIDELKRVLLEVGRNGRFTARDYRDATGIGRNLAIEVLEYFDRQGVTRRIGDEREVVGD